MKFRILSILFICISLNAFGNEVIYKTKDYYIDENLSFRIEGCYNSDILDHIDNPKIDDVVSATLLISLDF